MPARDWQSSRAARTLYYEQRLRYYFQQERNSKAVLKTLATCSSHVRKPSSTLYALRISYAAAAQAKQTLRGKMDSVHLGLLS